MKAIRLTGMIFLLLLLASSLAYGETCEYDTEWGVVTLNYNWNNNSVTGDYPYKNGSLSGTIVNGNSIQGQWWQSDGQGSLVFNLNASGFSGKWKYAGDSNWRGAWNGSLRGCN